MEAKKSYTPALFLDRDGVINHMVLYKTGWDSPQKPGDVKLIDGIEKVISWANKKKILVVEVSNQPGVAKGKMSQKTSDAIDNKVRQLLEEKGATINNVYICPHHPKAIIQKFKKDCDCRKPKPGLLLRAIKDLGIDPKKCIFLGDGAPDVGAGKLAKITTLLYFHQNNEEKKIEEAKSTFPDYKTKSLEEAFQKIKTYFK